MARKKTWREKLNSPKPSVVKPAPANFAGVKEGQMMLIPSPQVIDQFIREIPERTSVAPEIVRARLAEQHGAEVTCPLVFGILLRTVAEAAYEGFEEGVDIDDVTPVWRVLDEKAKTIKKLSYDPEFLFKQRQREGLSA